MMKTPVFWPHCLSRRPSAADHMLGRGNVSLPVRAAGVAGLDGFRVLSDQRQSFAQGDLS
jgi:hypothetical protein